MRRDRRHYADSSGAFAYRAATIAFGANPPEPRASVRGDRAPAQRTAEQHGDYAAVAAPWSW